MKKGGPFTSDKFVLCEGVEDTAFIRAFFAAKTAPQTFDLAPTKDIGKIGGNSGFYAAFSACEAITGFKLVKRVLLVADNDDDPVVSFDAVCAQLKKAGDDGTIASAWGMPKAVGNVAHGAPSVCVWMWPAPGVPGCLETLLWGSIEATFPARADCVVRALQCSGADAWPISKKHKAYVRCYLSLYCRKNPGVTLAALWDDPANAPLMPIMHASLDAAWAFLSAF